MQSNEKRAKRKIRIGVVVSDKMDKTITVRVDKSAMHPVYDKLVMSATKFKAHDEKEAAGIGDTVKIEETRPLSKTKRWRLVEIIQKAGGEIAAEGPSVSAGDKEVKGSGSEEK
jgi:small subunit ribosomal protein S17